MIMKERNLQKMNWTTKNKWPSLIALIMIVGIIVISLYAGVSVWEDNDSIDNIEVPQPIEDVRDQYGTSGI